MTDRHDRLRHERVVQHTSVRQEKSQQVLEAPNPSDHVAPSTSRARASPSSSSCIRRDSPTDVSLPPSSYRRQVFHIQTPEVPDSPMAPPIVYAYESVSPSTVDVVDPVSPPDDRVVGRLS